MGSNIQAITITVACEHCGGSGHQEIQLNSGIDAYCPECDGIRYIDLLGRCTTCGHEQESWKPVEKHDERASFKRVESGRPKREDEPVECPFCEKPVKRLPAHLPTCPEVEE